MLFSIVFTLYILALPISSASPTLGLKDGFLLILLPLVLYPCFCFWSCLHKSCCVWPLWLWMAIRQVNIFLSNGLELNILNREYMTTTYIIPLNDIWSLKYYFDSVCPLELIDQLQQSCSTIVFYKMTRNTLPAPVCILNHKTFPIHELQLLSPSLFFKTQAFSQQGADQNLITSLYLFNWYCLLCMVA